MTAESTGFDRSETAAFGVTTNARQRIEVALKTGSASGTVTVSSSATLLETESSAFPARQIQSALKVIF